MSKWKQIAKTRRLKERRNPQTRMERMTQLKREIKLYKAKMPETHKTAQQTKVAARQAEWELKWLVNEIMKLETELSELEQYEGNEK